MLHEHQHQNQHIFGLSPFHLTLNQPFATKKPNVRIFAEEKIHNLPVESDQSLKVHCLWEWFFIKRWSASFFFPLMAISFLRLSKVSQKKFLSFSLEFFYSLQGNLRVFLGMRSHFTSIICWLPTFRFGCVCLTLVCVDDRESVSMCVGVYACSWRCSDGVQVLHQALEVGHLLGQLVRLVALRERNRVTARGRGGAGGKGGKHLEGGRKGRRRREGRKGEGQSGIFCRGQGESYRLGEASWGIVNGTDAL